MRGERYSSREAVQCVDQGDQGERACDGVARESGDLREGGDAGQEHAGQNTDELEFVQDASVELRPLSLCGVRRGSLETLCIVDSHRAADMCVTGTVNANWVAAQEDVGVQRRGDLQDDLRHLACNATDAVQESIR